MSAPFDPSDKSNKAILDYFESKTWLIVDVSSGTRTSLRKTISQIGSKTSNMFDADNLQEAQSLIESKKPDYIVGHKAINGGSTVQLFDAHVNIAPNRLNAGFFVMAEASSVAEIGLTLEYEMDGIIALPFTGGAVIESIIRSVKHKIEPTPYLNKIEEGHVSLVKGDLQKAREAFQSATTLSKHSYEAYYYLGEVYRKSGDNEKAIASYEEAINLNSGCFKSLNRLRSLYFKQKEFKKAYNINSLMIQKYPTPPEKIPELIRLSIINEQYEDIMDYFDIFLRLKITDPQIQSSLSAGLAVLGRHFIKLHNIDKGIEALKNSFKLSNGKFEILKMISDILEECHKPEILYELFEGIDVDLWPDNAHIIYFHTFHLTSKDDSQVIAFGEKLLKRKIKDVLVYKGMIERSIAMNRALNTIESLVLEASKNFPEHQTIFENYLKKKI